MKLGDLVSIEWSTSIRDVGIIIRIGADEYKRKRSKVNTNPDTLCKIMVCSGKTLWLQEKRLRVISETKTR